MASTAGRSIEFTDYSAEGFVAKGCIGGIAEGFVAEDCVAKGFVAERLVAESCIAEDITNCFASTVATKTRRKGCADGGHSHELEQIQVGSGIGSNFATSQST